MLAAMGVAGFQPRIAMPDDVVGACLLLIDGLGAELLDTYAADAPVLAGLRGPTLQVGFPSTTAAGLAAIGTACRSGEHGMVGMSFRLPDVGVINALRWRPHPWGEDLRDVAVPERVQPRPTVFERAASTGVAVSVISGAEFGGSGADPGGVARRPLCRRARARRAGRHGSRRGGRRRVLLRVSRRPRPGGSPARAGFDGVADAAEAGRQVWWSRCGRIAERGTACGGRRSRHGGRRRAEAVDIDATESLRDGVDAIGGEVRARHIYTRAGALPDVRPSGGRSSVTGPGS